MSAAPRAADRPIKIGIPTAIARFKEFKREAALQRSSRTRRSDRADQQMRSRVRWLISRSEARGGVAKGAHRPSGFPHRPIDTKIGERKISASSLHPFSTSRNRLPAVVALRHIRVIAGRIGTVVPSLRGVGLAVIVISIVRVIAPPGISKRSAEEKPVIVKSTVMESTIVKSIPVKPTSVEAPVKPATVKSTKSAAVEATAATVETSGVGGIWLAERGCAQQSRCDCQSPSYPGPGSVFV